MVRSIFRSKWVAFFAVPVVLTGMAVEGGSRALSRRAMGSYWDAVQVGKTDPSLSSQARAVFAAARAIPSRRHNASGFHTPDFNALAQREPSEIVHRAAGYLALMRQRGVEAGRHLQLAARLAPTNAAAQARADQGVNTALLFQARRITRPVTTVGSILLFVMFLGAWSRRGARRRLRRYVESLRADVKIQIDGESRRKAVVSPDTQSLSIDLFLKGRYGMCCPRLMRQRPPIHVSFSQSQSSRTVRLTPVREVSDAIRIHVRPDTLDLLRAAPGQWRMHVRMDERTLALAPVLVASSVEKRPLLDRARGWFGS